MNACERVDSGPLSNLMASRRSLCRDRCQPAKSLSLEKSASTGDTLESNIRKDALQAKLIYTHITSLRCCTPFFVWRTLLRSLLSNIIFTIQPPADMTSATTASPSLQTVREYQTTLSIYMKTLISKAELFAIPIPAERVTLRIANTAIVSNKYTTALTTTHRLPPLCPKQLDGLDLLQHPLARFLPIL
jgi:hypothetical protein